MCIHSCWLYQYIFRLYVYVSSVPSGPPPACVQAAKFFFWGSRNRPTVGWGNKLRARARHYRQRKTKAEESGLPASNHQSCLLNVEWKDVSRRDGIQSSCSRFTEQCLLTEPHYCVCEERRLARRSDTLWGTGTEEKLCLPYFHILKILAKMMLMF